IFAAILVLIFAWYIGRFLAKIVTNVLTRARFNEVPTKLGIMKQPVEGGWTPSSVVGWIVLFLVMLFAILMAADLLDFAFVNELVADFTVFVGHVILAIVILGIGLFLANMAAKAIRAMGRTQSGVLALGAQAVILLLTIAIALRTLGIANEIVELGFGIVLGAIAVAVAIAFGLGGRDFAKRTLDRLDKTLKGD
ncbi:MAG: mechanosensitive ion channel, partial [Dehalococcoidia bacterium]|nr:mechanosensitive ion channel [Dehalococcoidia bacterium]